jgi:hypothetical protein
MTTGKRTCQTGETSTKSSFLLLPFWWWLFWILFFRGGRIMQPIPLIASR